MKYNVLVWNFNQATNIRGTNHIPDFVKSELKKRKKDIAIITEFSFCKNADTFNKEVFDDYGYDYRFTNNKYEKENEVLIAWKKDLFEYVGEEVTLTTARNNKPNFLVVHLKTRHHGIKLTVAGLRITLQSYKKRKQQMEYALEQLSNYKNVIIGGDLNNLRRGTPIKEWNIKVIEELCSTYQFNPLHTPSGQSIYQERSLTKEYEFAEDHFITKGSNIKMEKYCYDRNFIKGNDKAYPYGKDFQIYKYDKKNVTWSIPFGSGIPDHAILCGVLTLGSEKSN